MADRRALRFFVREVARECAVLSKDPVTTARRDRQWLEEKKKWWRPLILLVELVNCIMHVGLFLATAPFTFVTRFLVFIEKPFFWFVALWLFTLLWAFPAWSIFKLLRLTPLSSVMNGSLPICPASWLELGWTPLQLEFAMHLLDAASMGIPLIWNGTHINIA